MAEEPEGLTHGAPIRLAGRLLTGVGSIAIGVFGGALLCAQQLPFEPAHDSGQSITGAFERWFPNSDGSFSLLLGYYNRNLKEDLEIPVGPANRIEPGRSDQGQSTHFLTGWQWGVFTINVPRDFGDKKLTWTLAVNGKTTVIPLSSEPVVGGRAFP